MSTQRRIDSSRAAGLTSGQIVLSYESEEQFNALREEPFADSQPQNRSQVDLVDQLVATRWRLNRAISLKGALVEIQMARQQPEIGKEFEGCGGEIRPAIACHRLCGDSHALESLNRHETRLSAEFRRTLKLLRAQLRNQKLHDEPNLAKAPHYDEDRPTPRSPSNPTGLRPSSIDQRGGSANPEPRATSVV